MNTKRAPDLGARLHALSAFRDAFEASDFEFGHWVQPESDDGVIAMGLYEFSPTAQAFIDACYANGWVSPEIDWTAWSETDECRRLMSDPARRSRRTRPARRARW